MYKDFFSNSIDCTLDNITEELKKSNLVRSPKKWEKGGDINKRGGGYSALGDVSMIIYKQIKGIQ